MKCIYCLLCSFIICLIPNRIFAQSCCSGGSGSPIAGGTSQGVLDDRQVEIGMNFQYISSKKFFTGDKLSTNFLDNFNSKYLYTRFAYGVSSKFTFSLETGYYFNKTQIGLKKRDTISNSGFGDLIIFPRYCIYTHNTEVSRTEVTLGLGLKIPIGKYLDSSVVYTNPAGKDFYTPMPPAVMPTTGSNDFIFYGFGYRGYPEKRFRVFANFLYVRKGWNQLGQKFGDYAGIGLFAGRTFMRKIGVTLQLRGEWIDKMNYDHNIDMLAIYNLDVASTGGRRLLFVPQLNYNYKTLSAYVLSEIPIYQYVNGTAIGSQYLFTLGLSYRFLVYKASDE